MSLDLLEILYQALHAEIGIEVETEDTDALRQKLYAARREHPTDEFNNLTFTVSPFDPKTKLWIGKKDVSVSETHDDASSGGL